MRSITIKDTIYKGWLRGGGSGWLVVTVLIAVLAGCTFTAKAETVTQKHAAGIAELFFNAAKQQVMTPPKLVYNGRKLTTNRLFVPFYVYQHPTGGWVIIAADNKAYPILAYSLTDKFEEGDLAQRAILEQYARHIELVRYDSSVPEKVVVAWGDIKQYIHEVLTAQYDVTDLLRPYDESVAELDGFVWRGDAPDLYSEIYSPDQWTGMVSDQLLSDGNVIMGVLHYAGDEELIQPLVIHGRKGEYYRMNFGKPRNALYRLMPTELLSMGQVALLRNPQAPQWVEPQEAPFAYFDSYRQQLNEDAARVRKGAAQLEDASGPEVFWHGSGRFTVRLPEEVVMARTYDAAGRLVAEQTYRDTDEANINLTIASPGFYFALMVGKSGRPYGVKLYR